MEEMTSTVRQNADNAKVANDLAEETCEKAIQGGEVVNRAVTSVSFWSYGQFLIFKVILNYGIVSPPSPIK